MAVTTINLSDPISTLVTKTNTISSDVGDLSTLTTGDSSLTIAVNNLKSQIDLLDSSLNLLDSAIDLLDSAGVTFIARSSFLVDNSGATGVSLAYDSATGRISLSGAADLTTVRSYFQDDSAGGILFDSSTGQFSIAPNTVSNDMILAGTIRSDKFYNKQTVQILDSDNTVLVTIYSPGD
jgi:hypothetical protein